MNKEKRAELLLDHYKDSFRHTLSNWNARNRLFMFVLILLAFIALDIYSPGLIKSLINAYIAKTVGTDAPKFDFDVVGSVIWFLLLSLVIQYYKRSIQVDRQFKYLGNIEKRLARAMDGQYITREGKAYFSRTGVPQVGEDNKRPLYLRAVGPLYTYFFPSALTILVVVKIFKVDWPSAKVTHYFDTIIGLTMILYNAFYVRWIVSKK